MWLVTKHGFYSVVAHHSAPDVMLVRGRCRQDLEQLRRLSMDLAEIELEIPAIVETPENDYACRIFMPRETWETLATLLAMDIHYPNFKDEAHGDPERDAAYSQMWSTMRRFQELKARRVQEQQPRADGYVQDQWAFRRYVDEHLEELDDDFYEFDDSDDSDSLETAVYEYLDGLRDSGQTNMYGGRAYLQAEFGFDSAEAADWLQRWMQTYAERHGLGGES